MIAALFLGVFLGWTTGTPVNAKIHPMKGVFTPSIYQRPGELRSVFNYAYGHSDDPLPETLGKRADDGR